MGFVIGCLGVALMPTPRGRETKVARTSLRLRDWITLAGAGGRGLIGKAGRGFTEWS